MNRRRATAISVGVAMSVSACSESAPVAAPEGPLPELNEAYVSRQVIAAAAASVAIRGGGMQGSGEVVSVRGRNMVLTAGHVGKLTAGAHCNGAKVDAMLAGRVQSLEVKGSAGVYEGEHLTARDIALLGVDQHSFADASAIPLASKPPVKGENVYIVSWQPEGPGSVSGSQRNPVLGPIVQPAIIGATYQGKIGSDVAVFTPNGSSYDAVDGRKIPNDTTFKDGGSGSAVVNGAGEVVAEAAKSTTDSLAGNPDLQAELFHLTGDAFDSTYGVALGTVVSRDTVAEIAAKPLVPASECPLP